MDTRLGNPFSVCSQGHDLTQKGSVLYDARNNRVCKECARQNKSAKLSRKRGTFNS